MTRPVLLPPTIAGGQIRLSDIIFARLGHYSPRNYQRWVCVLALVTRKGLGDLIRENKGIKASLLIFSCLFISNMGNIIVNVAAFKTTAHMLNLPAIPLAAAMIAITFLFVTKGTYKILLKISCLFPACFIWPIYFPHLNQT